MVLVAGQGGKRRSRAAAAVAGTPGAAEVGRRALEKDLRPLAMFLCIYCPVMDWAASRVLGREPERQGRNREPKRTDVRSQVDGDPSPTALSLQKPTSDVFF